MKLQGLGQVHWVLLKGRVEAEEMKESSDPQVGPSMSPPPSSSLPDLLLHLVEELWSGLHEGDYFFFVDNVGLGWLVDL